MMKIAATLIQCMMRSGSGCRRATFDARLGAISGVSDLTAGADIEHTSAFVGAVSDQGAANAEREPAPNALAPYEAGDSGASAVASQNRAALLIARIAK